MVLYKFRIIIIVVTSIQGGPKNGYTVLFQDNFGNSAPILTILSLLHVEIYGTKK